MIALERKFQDLFKSQLSHKEIGLMLGLSKTSIHRLKKKFGLSRPSIERKISDEEIIAGLEDIPKLAAKHKIRKSSIYERINKLGIIMDKAKAHQKSADKCRKYHLDIRHFESMDEIGCYYLGFLYADGSIVIRKSGTEMLSITLARRDRCFLEMLLDDLKCSNLPIYDYVTKPHVLDGRLIKSTPNSSIRVYNLHLIKILKEYGMDRRNNYKKLIPKLNHYDHFIRGFLDGDGPIYISKIGKNKQYKYLVLSFAITYKKFGLQLQNLLLKTLRVNSSLYKSKKIFYLKFTGSYAEKVAEYIWASPIRVLHRKFIRYKNWLTT